MSIRIHLLTVKLVFFLIIYIIYITEELIKIIITLINFDVIF